MSNLKRYKNTKSKHIWNKYLHTKVLSYARAAGKHACETDFIQEKYNDRFSKTEF